MAGLVAPLVAAGTTPATAARPEDPPRTGYDHRRDPSEPAPRRASALEQTRSLRARDPRLAAALHRLGVATATRLNDLGQEAERSDDLEAATRFYHSRIRGRQEDLEEAETLIRSALAIRQRLVPDSLWVVDSLHGLGLIQWIRGDPLEARDTLRAGIDTLETVQDRIGGSDAAQAAFRAHSMDLYRDAIDLAVEVGALDGAVHILERSRARVLLAILAERDLSFARDVPEALERQRRANAAAYDQVQAHLARLSPDAGPEQSADLMDTLEELRQRQAELRQEVRRASSRLAALRHPEPLDLDGIRAALPRGTALLAYTVGRGQTQILVVDAAGALTVATSKVAADELRSQVVRLHRLIAQGRSRQPRQAELLELAGELFRHLVAPAAPALAGCGRLLIVADGPLHMLPFAALVRAPATADEDPAGNRPFLVESTPLHHALSVTVYAELTEPRQHPERSILGPTLIAFGDPLYPDTPGDSLQTTLEPLPASRTELQSIAAGYGDEAVVFVGADATEERVKSLDHSPRILHFAVHGLLDERFPLDSALALTPPESPGEGADNGLLQAWEVFEQLRIDADLVTLSACDTALGKEVAGEVMVGLTRAFHYAGARSVLASLWRVSDDSTAELMGRFSRHLRAGETTDQSLRLAQLELLRQPLQVGPEGQRTTIDARHPYHWAGFVLLGDPGGPRRPD